MQVRGLNAKLREFRSVLLDAMSGTPHDRLANGPCLMNHPARCLPQVIPHSLPYDAVNPRI